MTQATFATFIPFWITILLLFDFNNIDIKQPSNPFTHLSFN